MSKQQYFEMRQQEVASLLEQCEEGNESALSAYAQFKRLKDLYTEAEKQIQDLALDQASEYGEKTFSDHGFTFEKRNGSRRYSFKGIEEVDNAEAIVKDLKETYKQAYISFEKGITSVDPNTGEIFVLPKVTNSKDVLIVKK